MIEAAAKAQRGCNFPSVSQSLPKAFWQFNPAGIQGIPQKFQKKHIQNVRNLYLALSI
jgi:hypothetical protein